MFFTLSKVLTLFLFPLPFCILLGIFLSLFIVKGHRNKFFSILPILVLWTASSFPVCQNLVISLEKNFLPVQPENTEEADVAIVLGGMINTMTLHEKRVELINPVERLTDAIVLYKTGKVKEILFTGGSGVLFFDEVKEADLAKKFLIDMGVPENKIHIESESRNTYENAIYTSKIVEEKKWKKLLLITSAFHMKRSLGVFQKAGMNPVPFPTDYRALKKDIGLDGFVPTVGALDTTTLALKEWIGILVYKWNGYL